jgi:hypothetical protein
VPDNLPAIFGVAFIAVPAPVAILRYMASDERVQQMFSRKLTTFIAAGAAANGLALGDLPGLEQVELDAAGDGGDAGLAGLPGGEVAGFLGFAGAGPAGAVADEQAGLEDHQQERRERTVQLVRGEKPRP